jgi:hypothetical protein
MQINAVKFLISKHAEAIVGAIGNDYRWRLAPAIWLRCLRCPGGSPYQLLAVGIIQCGGGLQLALAAAFKHRLFIVKLLFFADDQLMEPGDVSAPR